MLSQGSILIIDDKVEDGQPISEQLKELCIPHLFFHADDEKIRAIRDNKPEHIQKVRIIFQDIVLTEGGSPGTAQYVMAETIIDHLLPDNNGPWLLATWSTYSEDNGDSHSELLFNHLSENLPPEKKPFSYVSLEKSKFTAGVMHGRVISYQDLSQDQRDELSSEVKKTTATTPAMSALMDWEHAVSKSVSDSIAELHALSDFNPDSDLGLGKLLLELSRAEAGKALDKSNSRHALIRILNNQLLNKVTNYSQGNLDLLTYGAVPDPQDSLLWKRRINSLLHIINNDQSTGTGSIYSFNSFKLAISQKTPTIFSHIVVNVTPWDTHFGDETVKKTYLELVESNIREDAREIVQNAINEAESVVVDITPPCDHAQTKALFRKFCGGILLKMPEFPNKKARDGFDKTFKTSELFWRSCHLNIEEPDGARMDAIILLNSKLVFTAPDIPEVNGVLRNSSINKVGEQMTREIVHWLGSQLNRPGLTYM